MRCKILLGCRFPVDLYKAIGIIRIVCHGDIAINTVKVNRHSAQVRQIAPNGLWKFQITICIGTIAG